MKLDRDIPILHSRVQVKGVSLVLSALPDLQLPLSYVDAEPSSQLRLWDLLTMHMAPTGEQLEGGRGYIDLSKRIKQKLNFTSQTKGCLQPTTHLITDIQMYVSFSEHLYIGRASELPRSKYREKDGVDAYQVLLHTEDFNAAHTLFSPIQNVPRYLLNHHQQTGSIQFPDGMKRLGIFKLEEVRSTFKMNFGGLDEPRGKWLYVYGGVSDTLS